MKRGVIYNKSRINRFIVKQGVSMEEFLRKALKAKEPIQANARMTYNERKDGVLPQHDIRTDRFEIALLATDKIHASEAAKRQAMDNPMIQKDENGNIIPQAEV